MSSDFIYPEDLSLFTSGSRFSLASVFLKEGMKDKLATFDLLVREMPPSRNFLVFAGLEQITKYLQNLKFTLPQLSWLKKQFDFSNDEMNYFRKFRFTGDMWAMPEGTIFFPNEPIVRITAPIIEAQLIEMFLINAVYLQTVLASKIARFVIAAHGKQVGIGFNRSYGTDAAMKSARINEIFGNSNSLAIYHNKNNTQAFGAGTFHYLIMAFDKEIDAFRAYLKHMKGRGYVLVDTYNSINGIKNFITVAKELKRENIKTTGIQLDSGDLCSLSIAARKMLDQAGLNDVKIFAMSNLDEWKVAELEKQGAPIDIYAGVTNLLTPSDAPTIELVYKLSEVGTADKIVPKIKTSTQKLSLPGRKQVYRIKKQNKYSRDVICLEEEKIEGQPLLQPIILSGKTVSEPPPLNKIKKRFYLEKGKFAPKLFSLTEGCHYPVLLSKGLKKLRDAVKKEIDRVHHYDREL